MIPAKLIFRSIRKDEERYRLTLDDGTVKVIRVTGGLIAPWADVGTNGHIVEVRTAKRIRFIPESTDVTFYSKEPKQLIAYTGL